MGIPRFVIGVCVFPSKDWRPLLEDQAVRLNDLVTIWG